MIESWPGNLRPLRRSAGSRPGYDGRWATHVAAQIRTLRGQFPCIVKDISVAGAKLHVGTTRVAGTHVFLLLADYGTFAARVAWRRNEYLGLNFSVRQPALLALAQLPELSSQPELS